MTNREWQRKMAFEGLMILNSLGVLLYICRLWPFLLLVILGIFVAALRLIFLSSRKVKATEPLPILTAPPHKLTEGEAKDMIFASVQKQVTALVLQDHPQARWIWERPDAKSALDQGEDLYILLSRAGGYRRARVVMNGFRVTGLEYVLAPPQRADAEQERREPAQAQEDYTLVAYEWVDAKLLDLNGRCNEAVGLGETELIIPADELPDQSSWEEICLELGRNGLKDAICAPEGIRISLV